MDLDNIWESNINNDDYYSVYEAAAFHIIQNNPQASTSEVADVLTKQKWQVLPRDMAIIANRVSYLVKTWSVMRTINNMDTVCHTLRSRLMEGTYGSPHPGSHYLDVGDYVYPSVAGVLPGAADSAGALAAIKWYAVHSRELLGSLRRPCQDKTDSQEHWLLDRLSLWPHFQDVIKARDTLVHHPDVRDKQSVHTFLDFLRKMSQALSRTSFAVPNHQGNPDFQFLGATIKGLSVWNGVTPTTEDSIVGVTINSKLGETEPLSLVALTRVAQNKVRLTSREGYMLGPEVFCPVDQP